MTLITANDGIQLLTGVLIGLCLCVLIQAGQEAWNEQKRFRATPRHYKHPDGDWRVAVDTPEPGKYVLLPKDRLEKLVRELNREYRQGDNTELRRWKIHGPGEPDF